MARKEKVFTVDGYEYRAFQLGALTGRKLWLELLKAVAPAVEKLAADKEATDETLAGALVELVRGLSEKQTEAFINALAPDCEMRERGASHWTKLEEVVFDEHFAGRYLSMTLWLGEMLLFNFLPFGSGQSVGALIGKLRTSARGGDAPAEGASPAEPPRSPHRTISTGS